MKTDSLLYWLATWFVIDTVTFKFHRGEVISTIRLHCLLRNWMYLHFSISDHATWNVLRCQINVTTAHVRTRCPCSVTHSTAINSNFEIFRRYWLCNLLAWKCSVRHTSDWDATSLIIDYRQSLGMLRRLQSTSEGRLLVGRIWHIRKFIIGKEFSSPSLTTWQIWLIRPTPWWIVRWSTWQWGLPMSLWQSLRSILLLNDGTGWDGMEDI